jgi:hypothetical protein
MRKVAKELGLNNGSISVVHVIPEQITRATTANEFLMISAFFWTDSSLHAISCFGVACSRPIFSGIFIST